MAQEIEYDRTLLGVEFPSDPVIVDSGAILRYCNATSITASIHTDREAARASGYHDLVAPITMYPSMAQRQRPDIKLKFGRTQLFSSESIEALAPLCAGDEVRATTHLKEVYAKTGRSGTMVFVVWETTLTNQREEKIASIQDSYVRWGEPGLSPYASQYGDLGKHEEEVSYWRGGERAVASYYEDVEVGDELGPQEKIVTMDSVREFETALGRGMGPSFFTDPKAAKREGLPGVIVPGPMSMALMNQLLSNWAAGGWVKKLDVVFRQTVRQNRLLRVRGVVTDKNHVDAKSQVECDVYLETEEGDRLVGGQAVILLPTKP